MLSPLQLFATKLAAFTAVLLYLVVDFFVWQGPVWSFVHSRDEGGIVVQEPVAQVYGETLGKADVQAYCDYIASLSGKQSMGDAYQISAILEMVRARILFLRAQYNDKNLPDVHQEALAALEGLDLSRATEEEKAELLDLLQVRLKEFASLERSLEEYCQVSDQEVQASYAALQEEWQNADQALPPLEECATSIRSALRSSKKELALHAYFDACIQEAFRIKKLNIYVR